MALQPREKRLAMIVGALGVALAAWFVLSGVRQAFQSRQIQLDALERDVRDKRFRTAQAALALEQFADWERRSLPRDREIARTLYQSWLVGTLADAKLTNVQVDPGRTTQLRDVYAKLPYTVRAQGSASAISRWLAAFYKADHLQQIRDLSLQPVGGGGDLQLTASIEALTLPGADRADKLSTSTGVRLDEARAAAATKTVTERNLFAAYVPSPPPRPPAPVVQAAPPPPPKFDESKYTFLTSIVYIDAEPQAWLSVRPTQQLLKLRAGDGIKIGRFDGKLVRIGDAEIEIEQAGKRRVVALGKSLGQSVEAAVGDL